MLLCETAAAAAAAPACMQTEVAKKTVARQKKKQGKLSAVDVVPSGQTFTGLPGSKSRSSSSTSSSTSSKSPFSSMHVNKQQVHAQLVRDTQSVMLSLQTITTSLQAATSDMHRIVDLVSQYREDAQQHGYYSPGDSSPGDLAKVSSCTAS